MSFPRYPRYKDSGVEWLGEVPEDWRVVPLKAVASHNDEVLDEATPPNEEILYVDISSVDRLDGIVAKEAMRFSVAPSRARRRVRDGDVIVSTVRTYLRAIARIRKPEDNLTVSTGFTVVRPQRDLVPDFLGYALSAGYFVEQVIARSTGVSYPAINASELVAIPVLVPPRCDQLAIARLLDRETAKIDALVAEQRQLIELLKEKRQAVISHAVTKGLNPDAPMKPSGIEWLRDVPADWSLERLESVCTFLPGKAHEPLLSEDGVHLCVTSRFVSTEGAQFKKCTSNLSPAKKGDTLMVMSDLPNGRALAKAYFVADSRSYAVNQRVCILRPRTIVPKYLYYLVDRSPELLQHDDGSNQTHLSNAEILKPRFPVPSPEEQAAIVQYLDDAVVFFNTLSSDIQAAIALLEERRTALISAAVTGKIDVRGLVEAAEAA